MKKHNTESEQLYQHIAGTSLKLGGSKEERENFGARLNCTAIFVLLNLNVY